jgi:hypothetical protein
MVSKRPIVADRVRTVPRQFSWIDHRLVRDRHIEHLNHRAAALYLFLVTVADAAGLSYYSDRSICRRLAMDPGILQRARADLSAAGLIAWQSPLYQVLSLEPPSQSAPASAGGLRRLGDILKAAAGGGS